MEFQQLLSPGKIGTLELKNRIIMPAMGTGHPDADGKINQRLIDYHARRAKGGCAMNIVEFTCVHPTAAQLHTINAYNDDFLPGLTKLAEAVHNEGGKICLQLWHGGRQTGTASGEAPWAPSAIPCPFIQAMPHVMSKDEINEIVQAFGSAALRAKKAGFDAVEIHGAHGYLIDCFLNSYSNNRTDEYGGSLENRARFGCEVIREIRKQVGKDFPVLLRISATENVDNGVTLEDTLKVAALYKEEGIDALNVSQGCYTVLPYTVPPYYQPIALNVESAATFRKALNIPVIAAGRITSPELAEELIRDEKVDFVGIGRGQLSDPDYVTKLKNGESDQIVRCISCEQGCVERFFQGTGISCIFNPAACHEAEVVIKDAEVKKNVLVIGGGPAGLESARVASERGHKVTLFEKSVRLGGQFLLAGFAPYKEGFSESASHMGYRAIKAGVDVRLYTEATEDRIKKVNPDEIIIATGSASSIPPIPGVNGGNVFDARRVIGAEEYISASEVTVIGGGLVGLEVAEILACQGKKITIIEMLDKVGKDLEVYIQPYAQKIIQNYHMKVYVNTKAMEIKPDSIVVETDGKKQIISCGAVIMAVGAKSNQEVVSIVEKLKIPYKVIGDAQKPGKVLNAIWSGNEVGRTI